MIPTILAQRCSKSLMSSTWRMFSKASTTSINLNTSETLLSKSVEMIVEDKVAYMTLSRPEKRNALSTSSLRELKDKLDEIEVSKSIHVVVLQALGPVFSSGHDLKEVMSEETGRDEYVNLFTICSEVMMKITSSSKPVIAVVDGIATAAGCTFISYNTHISNDQAVAITYVLIVIIVLTQANS